MSTDVGLARENVGLLPNEIGAPGYTEEAGVLNALFASVLPATLAFIPGPRDQGEGLEQGRCTFGGRGSVRGRLKQKVHRP